MPQRRYSCRQKHGNDNDIYEFEQAVSHVGTFLSVRYYHLSDEIGTNWSSASKLKCDETKPVCKRCARLNRKCEGAGYSLGGGLPVTVPNIAALRATASFLMHPSLTSRLNATAEVKDLIHLVPKLLQASNYAQLMDPITSVPAYIKSRGKPVGIFLQFLPARSGHSSALDSTVDCVVGALRDLLRPQQSRNWSATYSAYGRALQQLQASLNDPSRCQAAETLCATQLLGIFEVSIPVVDAP